jgi:hypothetical protein
MIQEPVFSVPNTEFEGGGNGHGHSEGTFLIKYAQPSHTGDILSAGVFGQKKKRHGKKESAPEIIVAGLGRHANFVQPPKPCPS